MKYEPNNIISRIEWCRSSNNSIQSQWMNALAGGQRKPALWTPCAVEIGEF